MRFVALDIGLDRSPLHHVDAEKSRQAGHAEEVVRLVKREIHGIDALAFKEIGRVVESLLRCIPGRRDHVLLALQQTAAAVLLRRIGARAAVIGVETAMPFGAIAALRANAMPSSYTPTPGRKSPEIRPIEMLSPTSAIR